MRKKTILWIAPNLNHYKIRFLKSLQQRGIKVIVLAGAELQGIGHKIDQKDKVDVIIIRTSADKNNFQNSPSVYFSLLKIIRSEKPDIVLMPSEKKHIFSIMYLALLRRFYHYKFVTYTHPIMRSQGLKFLRVNLLLTKGVFSMYDRIIFYTEQAMQMAITAALVPETKAYYANNTLDTDSIRAVYNYVNPPKEPKLLFIGRLTKNKRIDLLLEYYEELKKQLPRLKLVVIGDGPESFRILEAAKNDGNIDWRGVVVDEAVIAKIMCSVQLVFLPGRSGLSLVHSFCYGRAFATIVNKDHAPEIAYLNDGVNGLLLTGDFGKDVRRLLCFLNSSSLQEEYSRNAYKTAENLSINNWCKQIISSIDGA